MVWLIVVFKVATSAFIFWHEPTIYNAWFQVVMNVVPIAVVLGLLVTTGAGAMMLWYRLRRARSRRRALVLSEWNVNASRHWKPALTRGKIAPR